MSQVYVVRNQDGLFISKQKEWLDGRDTRLLFRCNHKDEALNMVFELSSRDIYLRAEAIIVDLSEKKQPVVEVTAPIPVVLETDDPQPDSTSDSTSDSTPKLQLVTD